MILKEVVRLVWSACPYDSQGTPIKNEQHKDSAKVECILRARDERGEDKREKEHTKTTMREHTKERPAGRKANTGYLMRQRE